MRAASRLVCDKIADGFVSAGNTGACMAVAKAVQGVVVAWIGRRCPDCSCSERHARCDEMPLAMWPKGEFYVQVVDLQKMSALS